MPSNGLHTVGNFAVVLAIGATLLALSSTDDAPWSSPVIFVDPTDASSPPALSLPPPAAERGGSAEARIVFAGDIMQHENQRDDDFERGYAKVAPLLRGADIAVGNLEFPVDPARPIGPLPQSDRFNGSPAHLDAIARAGFTLLATANDHAFDDGIHGLRATIREVRQRGVQSVGTALSRARLDREVVLVERNGIRVAFFAYTSLLNTYVNDEQEFVDPPARLPVSMVNLAEWADEYREQGLKRFRADVQRARELFKQANEAYAQTDPSEPADKVQKYLRIAAPLYEQVLDQLDKARTAGVPEAKTEALETSAAKRLYDCRKRMRIEH